MFLVNNKDFEPCQLLGSDMTKITFSYLSLYVADKRFMGLKRAGQTGSFLKINRRF